MLFKNYSRMFFFMMVVTLLIIGCDGGGGGGDGGNNNSMDDPSSTTDETSSDSEPGDETSNSTGEVDEILYDETKVIFEETRRILNEDVAESSTEDQIQAIVDYALNQSIVAEAYGNNEENNEYVLIRFINGAFHMISFVDDSMDYPSEPAQVSSRITGAAASFDWTIPDTDAPKAVFAEHLCYSGELSVATELAELARNHGYTSYVGRDDTLDPHGNLFMGVEFFKTLADYQLVWIHSHGDYFEYPRNSGQFHTSIMTNDIVTEENHEAFKKDRGWDRPYVFTMDLVEKDAVSGQEEKIWYYGVTDLFISKYCGTFTDNSIVHLSMCKGGKGKIPMARSLWDKKAGAVLGWQGLVSTGASITSSKYLYTRMFGDIPGYIQDNWIQAKTPPLRPSSLGQAYDGMISLGYDVDIINTANWGHLLVLWPGMEQQKTDIMLVPSIKSLLVEIDPTIDEETLTISGQFGSEPDAVLVNETEAQILSFDHDEIVVDLTSLEENTSGPVVVETDGRRSNEHILSLWEQEITGEGRLVGLVAPQAKVMCNISFRGEILRERPGPESDPEPQNGELGTTLEKCSECEFKLSGTFEDVSYIYEYDGLPGNNQTLQVSVDPEKFFLGSLRSDEGELTYQLILGGKGQVKRTRKDDPLDVKTIDYMISIPLSFNTATIDEDGKIAEGQDTMGSFLVKWKGSDPSPKPDDKTAR